MKYLCGKCEKTFDTFGAVKLFFEEHHTAELTFCCACVDSMSVNEAKFQEMQKKRCKICDEPGAKDRSRNSKKEILICDKCFADFEEQVGLPHTEPYPMAKYMISDWKNET